MKTYGTLTLRDRGTTWAIDAQPHVHLRAKRVFGQLRQKARGELLLRVTPESCRDVAWFVERYPLEMTPDAAETLAAGAARHRDSIARLDDLMRPDYQAPELAMTSPPRSYQAREAAILLELGRLLVADDVGLGKTVTAITAMMDRRALPAVVVCAPHLQRQWARKVHEFAPTFQTHILKRTEPYPLPEFLGQPPDVVITTYHKLGGWVKVLAGRCGLVVFDEIQELRHPSTQRYYYAHELCSATPFRLGLSATPIHNYGAEIHAVLGLLAPDALGTAEEFETEWCSGGLLKDPSAFGSWARDQFLIVRHTRKEVGRELPPVTRVIEPVDCDSKALDQIQDTAAKLARIILETGPQARGAKWEASEQLSVLLRQWTGIAKASHVAAFVRMLLASGERVVLCGWHREVYRIWQDALREFNPVLYTGTESPVQKAATIDAFIAGRSQLLILSLRSGAGVDGLQAVSSCIVFGELDWSPAVHEQCIGRVARDGQDTPVMAYFLVADEGSDPPIAEALGLKREQLEGIRNPGATDFLEIIQTDGSHVRKLAAAYLAQIGQSAPEERAS